MNNHFDVIVIGAGISGIGAGYHLQTKCPEKSYAILEGRDTIGGTWDLFKYPGIRSDSDMYTLGFSFFPWKEKEAIADGPSILKYLDETSKKFNIDKKIKFNHYVKDASWCSEKSMWTLEVEDKDITIAKVGSPSDTTANNAGIIIKGASDKTLLWKSATNSLSSNRKLAENAGSSAYQRPSTYALALGN